MYRFLLKPCHPKELQMTILQGSAARRSSWPRAASCCSEHQKTQNLLEELEKATPGITKIEMDEDGAIMMDDSEARCRRRAVAARRSRARDGEGGAQIRRRVPGSGSGYDAARSPSGVPREPSRHHSKLDERGAPGKAAAEGFQQQAGRRACTRPSRTPVSSASGTEAVDVLP